MTSAIYARIIAAGNTGREFARDGPARRLIGRLRADLEVRPDILRSEAVERIVKTIAV